jgi:hypothetical protein
MLIPEKLMGEIVELFDPPLSEVDITKYNIHKTVVLSAASGEGILSALQQFVQRGGTLKDWPPRMILQALGSLANRGIAGSLAGDHMFAGICIQKAGVFIGGMSASEALHAFDTLSGLGASSSAELAESVGRLKLAPTTPRKPKRKPFWKL